MSDKKPFLIKLGRRIRQIRERQGLTAAQVAERADVEASFLSKLENGLVWFGPESLPRIARALGVEPGELMPSEIPVDAIEVGVRLVPLLNRVHAGNWQEIIEGRSVDDLCEFIRVVRDNIGPRAFALRVEGESMMPVYAERDVIVVDPDAPPRPGKPVIAQNGVNEWTFKIYKIDRIDEQGREIVKLVPLNDSYPTVYSSPDTGAHYWPVVEHHRFPY